MKSDKKLAEEIDKLKGTGHELDGYVPVEGPTVKNPRAVLSIRMGNDELDQIEAKANEIGVNVSEFIRTAALQRAQEDAHWQSLTSSTVTRLLGEVQSLTDSLEGIQDALNDAFLAAPHVKGGPEAVASGYRGQINARFAEFDAVRKSLDEFWQVASAS